MKVLFIGGSGNISSACSAEACKKGIDLFHFNRGHSKLSKKNSKITLIQGDINSPEDREDINKFAPFDVVVNFIIFTPEQLKMDLEFFKGKTKQYIFISSATVYEKPPQNYLIQENCKLANPFWEYAQNKIACEELLVQQTEVPYTIVRPSYTYGKTWLPFPCTANVYNPIYRMRNSLPLISHGDGESLWVMTHNIDFARALIGLFGNEEARNNSFHITSDEVLTWNQIYKTIGEIIGVKPELLNIPSQFIAKHDPAWGAGLLGDKAYSVVFDNTKIKTAVNGWNATISFKEGIRESINWFEENKDRMRPDIEIEKRTNQLITKYLNNK